MEMILISKKDFKAKTDEILRELELSKLREIRNNPNKWADIDELHRVFHGHIYNGLRDLGEL